MRERSDDGIPRVDIVGGRDAVEDGDAGCGCSKKRVLADELAGQGGGSVEPRGDHQGVHLVQFCGASG